MRAHHVDKSTYPFRWFIKICCISDLMHISAHCLLYPWEYKTVLLLLQLTKQLRFNNSMTNILTPTRCFYLSDMSITALAID